MPRQEGVDEANALVSSDAEVARSKQNPWQIVTVGCFSLVVIMAVVAGVFAVIYGSGRVNNANRDFVLYWATARLMVHSGNPYDVAENLRLQRSIGTKKPEMMLNPPVIFLLILPLGFLNAENAAALWFVLLAVSLGVSIWMLWVMNGRKPGKLHLVSLCYMPVLYSVMSGQIGIFLLLAVTLFLRFHQRRPYVAGAALLLCATKPHLFLPLGIVLLLWIVTESRESHRILVGFIAAFGATAAVAFYFDPQAWTQWMQMVRTQNVVGWPVPSLERLILLSVHSDSVWLEFLPEAAGCVWAAWYFWTRRANWSWTDQGLLVLLVSVACPPHTWITDQAVLLPAILAGAYRAEESGRPLLPFVLIMGVELLEMLCGAGMASPNYLWTVPVWLACYLYAVRVNALDVGPAESRA